MRQMTSEQLAQAKAVLAAHGITRSDEEIQGMYSAQGAQLGNQGLESVGVGQGLNPKRMELAMQDPVFAEKILKGAQFEGQSSTDQPPVASEPTKTDKAGTGSPGTWETAAMSVSQAIPSIIEASRYRHPYAPAPNIGNRRVLDIPTAAGVYGKQDKGFQSLLAQLLRGR